MAMLNNQLVDMKHDFHDFHVSFPDHSNPCIFDIEVRDESLETRGHNKGWGYGREINEQFLGCRQAPKKQFNKEYNYKISIIYLYLYIYI